MVDTFTLTTNKQIIKPDNNTYVNNWSTPVNSDWDIIDKAFGNQVGKSSTGSDVALSISDVQNQRVKIEGALSNSISVTIPFIDGSTSLAVGGMWVFDNETTGNYTVTVKTIVTGSVGVELDQGKRSLVYSDGTNCYFADDRAGGGEQPSGGGTNKIFFENDLTVTDDYIIPASKNAMTAGPVTVNSGVTVTVQPTSTWTIV
jgi:hypothetical protein